MLVVTANWRISDGTLAAPPARAALHRFRAGVRLASLRAGMRRDGSYRPVEAVDVVFAGDTFDWLLSREWTGGVRPWQRGRRAADALGRVAAATVGRGRRLVAALAVWARCGIEVPAADRHGRPSRHLSRRAPVRVTLLAGDSDRDLERLAGHQAAARGVAVGRAWEGGDVAVRHGDELDPLCGPTGEGPTLAETLAIELLARFGADTRVAARLGPTAPKLLRHLAGGPWDDAAIRLADWLAVEECTRGCGAGTAERRFLADAWNRAVGDWHRVVRKMPIDCGTGIDDVERLAARLELREDGRRRFATAVGPLVAAGEELVSPAVRLTVLGHRPAAAADSRRPGVLDPGSWGLSAAAGRGDDREVEAVVVRPDRGGWSIDPLPPGDAAAGSRDRFGEGHGRGVWISPGRGAAAGIVDAA